MTDRRSFLGAAAACLAARPLVLAAQPARVPRIGILNNGFAASASLQFAAFRDAIRDLGWIEGARVAFESRWAKGRPERIPALIDELVRARVDVIVVSGPGAISCRASRDLAGT